MLTSARRRQRNQTTAFRRRRLFAETLEDRRLLAVSFEFNYLEDNTIGFNDAVEGAGYRSALESAASRLGSWLLHDSVIEIDVVSQVFDGTAIARASSQPANPVAGGGFAHAVIPGKIIDQVDQNGAAADGRLEVSFFAGSDPFFYATDPSEVDADDEIDFQAVIIHELVHTLGFTSATNADGSDDSGDGITTPGTWSVFDQFVSDASGERLIDSDPMSANAFRMDTTSWATHSVGGPGPAGGLFFDGPIAKSVYGGRIPLYSPATFQAQSSVSHLDSEGFPDESFVFSPLTHLMSHAIVDGQVPQELTLLEKAMLADVGIQVAENVPPKVTAPANLVVEANNRDGFLGTNQVIADYLASAVAVDELDPNPVITHNKPTLLVLGQNLITFSATDASGNVGTANSVISVFDTTPPTINVTPAGVTFEATGPSGVANASLPFVVSAADIVDPNPVVTFSGGTSFPLGSTIATYSARDFRNNVAQKEVEIVVRDSTPPQFLLPAAIRINSNLLDGADLNNEELINLIRSSSSDIADDELEISAEPSTIPFGVTDVTFTVTDDSGNSSAASTSVTVDDSAFVVRTLDDELDANPGANLGDLSLREAISLANARVGADIIRFETGLVGSVLLKSTLGQLVITDSVVLTGLGRGSTVIDGQASMRVVDIGGNQVDVTIEDLTVRGGRLTLESDGGAGIRLDSDGDLRLNRVELVDNETTGTAAAGGGIQVLGGNLTLVDSLVTGNKVTGEFASGGGIWIGGGGDLTVIGSTLTNNATEGNYASGGGLYALDGVTTITDSTLAANTTSGNRAGGGAIAIIAGEVTLRSSTISGNSTAGASSPGGGLRSLLSPTHVINSTVSGNSTSLISPGGGLFVDRGSLVVEHSTIASNVASGTGGGIAVPSFSSFPLHILNSIVADNDDVGSAPDFTGAPALSAALQVRYSLIGDNTGTTLSESQTPDPVTGNLVGDSSGGGLINPKLGPLTDNGGPTRTHLLQAGSPAINAGNPSFDPLAFSPPLVNDQRGDSFTRLIGDRVDIGAVEIITDLVITWANPDPITFGTLLGPDQLNAVANVPGTFSYTPAAGTLLEPGPAQALTALFTPNDLDSFDPTSVTVFIDVLAAAAVVTWANPEDISFGTPLSSTQLNATANVPGFFSYVPPAGVLLSAGLNQTLTVTFTPTSTELDPVNATVKINVHKADPLIVWNDPAAVVVGTELSDVQLNASTIVPGTFSYDPVAGTLLGVGDDQPLTATFTPANPGNYNSVQATVFIDVIPPHDFGDAPSPYPVLLAENGARHLPSTLFLGSSIDMDLNGQPTPQADGDEDDGVTLVADAVAVLGAQTTASWFVEATEAGNLDAWIDWNQDGDWNDPGEKILISTPVNPGTNLLSYAIPASAKPGTTAARFRLSSAGSLAPTGAASDGEVEDYLVNVLDGANSPTVSVQLVELSIEVFVDANQLVVGQGDIESFRAPVANVGALLIEGNALNQSITLHLNGLPAFPTGGLQIGGGIGGNTLIVQGAGESLDLTDPSIQIASLRRLDLSHADDNQVVLDVAAVERLSPMLKVVEIVAGEEDRVVVSDHAGWRMADPIIVNETFFLTAVHLAGGEVIQAELPRAWQNFLRPGDVNNDGQVTAADALRIINELSRREFSNPESQDLDEPLTVEEWPNDYFDHNGDYRATALDALRVINDLARLSLNPPSSDGELANATPDVWFAPSPDASRTTPRDGEGSPADGLPLSPALGVNVNSITYPAASTVSPSDDAIEAGQRDDAIEAGQRDDAQQNLAAVDRLFAQLAAE